MVASEIKNPQRNLPLALIFGTRWRDRLYMLANWAYFRVLTLRPMWARINWSPPR
jgi:amino acid transporter